MKIKKSFLALIWVISAVCFQANVGAVGITSGSLLPTAGIAPTDHGSTGWQVTWSDPGITLDWTPNAGYDPAGAPSQFLQGNLVLSAIFLDQNIKIIHFQDVTPSELESPNFGLRFNMNLQIHNNSPVEWNKFSYALMNWDTMPDVNGDGSAEHPWLAHFHRVTGFNPGTLTLESPLTPGGLWLNPSFYANFVGTITGTGGFAQIDVIAIHDYEGFSDVGGRFFDLVLIPNAHVPEPATLILMATCLLLLVIRRRRLHA
jgi:hypothetical protein